MSLPCRIKLFAVIIFFAMPAHAQDRVFKICAEPDNLPMAEQGSRSGLDIEVAELLAKDMGKTLEVQWIPQRDYSYFRQTLDAGVCDAIMSVPRDFERLTTTDSWYRTGFVFVTRAAQNFTGLSFDDPRLAKMTIAVPATGLGETPPALALTKRGLTSNLRPYSVYDPHAMIAAIAKSEADVAILWGPFAGWIAPLEKVALQLTPTPDQDGSISLSYDIAIGVRKGNSVLRDQLNISLRRQRDAIRKRLEAWRVPQRKL